MYDTCKKASYFLLAISLNQRHADSNVSRQKLKYKTWKEKLRKLVINRYLVYKITNMPTNFPKAGAFPRILLNLHFQQATAVKSREALGLEMINRRSGGTIFEELIIIGTKSKMFRFIFRSDVAYKNTAQ